MCVCTGISNKNMDTCVTHLTSVFNLHPEQILMGLCVNVVYKFVKII